MHILYTQLDICEYHERVTVAGCISIDIYKLASFNAVRLCGKLVNESVSNNWRYDTMEFMVVYWM